MTTYRKTICVKSLVFKMRAAVICGICACGIFGGRAHASDLDSLASKLARDMSISQDQAKNQIETMFRLLGEELESGNEIQVKNFGTFYVKKRAPRTGRNPRTGESLQIPEKSYPRFRASNNLKETLNLAVPPATKLTSESKEANAVPSGATNREVAKTAASLTPAIAKSDTAKK